ncbi:MAG: 23S rRNA (pseudouridine(1915)-N(3))-methyltransferase RlmH [Solirubrobacterales bacterium]|nr:23S rRNA (pseudouridine(1915)-N(3))-methyltransferase RlmH [Solirubrobacterales bacterium]
MKVTVLAVGRIKAPFAEAEARYLKLARPRERIEVIEVKDDAALLRRVDPRHHSVSLDPESNGMSSEEWARWLDRRRHEGRDLTFLIGGPAGLPGEVRERAAESVSLGRHTMAHQLARVVLLEQIFRAGKIIAGERYHL